jgi:hypothetical protein
LGAQSKALFIAVDLFCYQYHGMTATTTNVSKRRNFDLPKSEPGNTSPALVIDHYPSPEASQKLCAPTLAIFSFNFNKLGLTLTSLISYSRCQSRGSQTRRTGLLWRGVDVRILTSAIQSFASAPAEQDALLV